MLSVYAKWKGTTYLKATLQKVLERLVLTSKDLDLELDPARTSSAEELQKNALQLRVVTRVFIDDICNSAAHIPVSFRKICSIVSLLLNLKFRASSRNYTDIYGRHEALPRSQVHSSWGIHISPILLSSHCSSRCRGPDIISTFKGDAPWPLTHRKSSSESSQQRAVWGERALHVSPERLSHSKYLSGNHILARNLSR